MINKKLFYLLFLSISISNCFAMQDTTKISKAEQTYYEDDREWEYLERILIRRLETVYSKTKTKINNIAKGSFVGLSSLLVYLIKSDSSFATKTGEFIFASAMFTGFTGFTVFVIKKIVDLICSGKIKKERLINTIEMFLQKYNPEIDHENDVVNYKKIIPEELHKTFDALYEEYTEHGKEYLEENSIGILNSIIDKIVYEVKIKKYDSIRENQRAQAQRISSSMDTAILAGAIRSRKK